MNDQVELVPNTFITRENRNGRPWQADAYVCSHGVIMDQCDYIESDRECTAHQQTMVHMVTWWNNNFAQMQDRTTVRDQMLRNAYA